MTPSPFERQLRSLLQEALKSQPSAEVVGALIGAAIAAIMQAGKDPREELPSVVEKTLKIVFGNQRPS